MPRFYQLLLDVPCSPKCLLGIIDLNSCFPKYMELAKSVYLLLFSFSSFPGGPVGGCQVSSGGAFNMGYVQGKPQAAPDGSVSIRYMNGSPCHKGTAHQGHRSTRINFYCADTEVTTRV